MKNVTFQTHDFYAACVLRASKIPLINLLRGEGKFLIFVFESSPEICEEIIKKHWDRSLQLESRLLVETINELKSRIYEKNNY